MSINGPWDEDPMWVPDLQDSDLANTCLKCQQLEAELEKWKDTARTWMWAAADASGEDISDVFDN
jgi:hypothetical protein